MLAYVNVEKGFDAVAAGENVSCPVLLISGDSDNLVPMSAIKEFGDAIKSNDKVTAYEISIYKGFGHAFAHHPQTAVEATQSEDALRKAVDWLHKYLR